MFGRSGIEGSNTDPAGLFAINSRIRSFVTVTGRLGYAAVPTMLVYAKGGGAWVRDNYTLTEVTGTTLTAASTIHRTGPSAAVSSGPSQAIGLLSPNTLSRLRHARHFLTSNTSELTFP